MTKRTRAKAKRRDSWTPEDDQFLRDHYPTAPSIQWVADRLYRSEQGVRVRANILGVKRITALRLEDNYETIVASIKAGISANELAKTFGINKSTILAVKRDLIKDPKLRELITSNTEKRRRQKLAESCSEKVDWAAKGLREFDVATKSEREYRLAKYLNEAGRKVTRSEIQSAMGWSQTVAINVMRDMLKRKDILRERKPGQKVIEATFRLKNRLVNTARRMQPLTDDQRKIAEDNYWLVQWAYKKYRHLASSHTRDDLEIQSTINYCFIAAVRNWQPELGKLSTYFSNCVISQLKYRIQDTCKLIRVHQKARAAGVKVPVGSLDNIEAEHEGLRLDVAHKPSTLPEDMEYLDSLIAELEPQFQFIIRKRLDGMLLREVGDALGYSRGRIQQFEQLALDRLKEIHQQREGEHAET